MKQFYAYATLALSIAFAGSILLVSDFDGFSESQLPIPQVDPPIQPAGYAFRIWGLIYGWLIVSAVFGVLKRRHDEDWNRARLPLMVSLLVGVPWLAIAVESAEWAMITIIIMAIAAIASLWTAPLRDRWWFQAPVAIYAGWLTAASCVAISSVAAGYGIGTDQFGWAFLGIAFALMIAILVFERRRSAPEYVLTVIWALVGIIIANGMAILTVSATAALGIAILLCVIAMRGSSNAHA